jgi:L-amino acid N-acyltransferase YncA
MIYVARSARGRGGRARASREARRGVGGGRIWTLQAGVFPENEASLRLHESCGFRRVGVHERLGEHHGVWRDVVLLERRSSAVGQTS